MIKKINITLGILCVCGALFIGGVVLYSKVADVSQSEVAKQVEGSL